MPPGDPQRRLARRLCRRSGPQAPAARGGRSRLRVAGTATDRIALAATARLGSTVRPRGLAMTQIQAGFDDRPRWKRIVDFPLVAMLIAIGLYAVASVVALLIERALPAM